MRFVILTLLFAFTQSLQAQVKSLIMDTISSGKYQRIHFTPTTFHREFSSTITPALTIQPGDTISTESVDAGGFDKTGTKKSERGNPLTGPFYIEGAVIGDVIAVTITKLSLNRNYATTLETLVPRILPKKLAKQTWRKAKLVRWNLDLEKNTGTPAKPYDHLKELTIPLKPFLGCVGIAPDGKKGISTSDSGPFGGNMDYNRVTESATVYLPVFHDGALLFMGDGHAVQGDGELNGDALETSMDFEFTVQLIKKDLSLHFPIIEDPEYFMIFGIEKNLDKAMKTATLDLLAWLQKNYQLSFQEASQVIGPSVEYTIAKIAATKVEVVAKIRKEILMDLKK